MRFFKCHDVHVAKFVHLPEYRDHETRWSVLQDMTKKDKLPIIFINSDWFGDRWDLIKIYENGDLNKMLDSAFVMHSVKPTPPPMKGKE